MATSSKCDNSCENGDTMSPERYSVVRKALPEVSYIDLEDQCIPCDIGSSKMKENQQEISYSGRRNSILNSSLLRQALTLFSTDSDSDNEEEVQHSKSSARENLSEASRASSFSNDTQASFDFHRLNRKSPIIHQNRMDKNMPFRRGSIISTATVSSEFEFSGEVNPYFGLHPLRDPKLTILHQFETRLGKDTSSSLECTTLALSFNGDILVADAGTNKVESFRIGSKLSKQQNFIPGEDILPWCVTVLPSGEFVLICFSSSQNITKTGKDFSVRIFDTEGKFFQAITRRNPSCVMGNGDNSFTIYDDDTQSIITYARPLEPHTPEGPFAVAANLPLIGDIGLIMHIAGDVHGNCYCSDWIKKCVSVFNSGGIHTYMIGMGQLSVPRGLCIDPHGRMFVVEMGSNKLYCTRPDYTLVALDVPGELVQPTDCAVDQDSNLYVLNAQGSVAIYKYV